MKMDGCQNKGVAGRAFCKRLKRNGMDGGNRMLFAGLKLSDDAPQRPSTDMGRVESNYHDSC
jgi:hypothetical protein